MSATELIVCPHCGATNRVPQDRIGESPKCGNCHNPLFTQKPVVLTSQNAQKIIQTNEVLTIVDFWASWCQPCLMMAPQFEQAAAELNTTVLAKLQTDLYEQAAAHYNIRSLPTMVAFRGGKEVARQSGALLSQQIVQWVQSLG